MLTHLVFSFSILASISSYSACTEGRLQDRAGQNRAGQGRSTYSRASQLVVRLKGARSWAMCLRGAHIANQAKTELGPMALVR